MRVTVRGTNIEGALRLFRKKITESGTLFQYKEKMHYEKDTTKRQRKMAAAKNREKKRQGATSAQPKLF
jgi:ribosomal protein S21